MTPDEELEQLEEKLTALYVNATNDIKAEFTDFMAEYSKQYEDKRLQVEAGTLSADEFTAWNRTQLLNQTRYTKAVENMTNMLVNTDEAAMATLNSYLPQVIAQSYDYVTALGAIAAEGTGLTMETFQIYNAETVQALIKDNPTMMPSPRVDIPEDKRWNKSRINRELTQGIVKGESIPKIADRLAKVTTMDKNAAIRNARTSMTAAENMGRSLAADDLKEQGIPTEEVWSAAYDSRTRDSHLLLDGTTRDASGYFGVGILATPLRFPADPLGDPEEVYNCRCRLNIQLKGIDHSKEQDLYEQFMKENHPEDWKALQENEAQQARNAEVEAAKDRKEELLSQQSDLKTTAEVKEPEIITKEPEKAEPVASSEVKTEETAKWGGHHEDNSIQYTLANRVTDEGAEAIAQELNVTTDEAADMANAICDYSGYDFQYIRAASQGDIDTMHRLEEENGDWIDVDEMTKKAEDIEKFIDLSPKWDGGELERGVHFKDDETVRILIEKAERGEAIDMKGMSSWTSDANVAQNFAETWNKRNNSVIFVTNESKTDLGTSIQHLSNLKEEKEVLISKDAEFVPTRSETKDGITYIFGDLRRKA